MASKVASFAASKVASKAALSIKSSLSKRDKNARIAAAKPANLTNQELVVLETTLRVQLHVGKHVRIAQVTGAVGAAMLRGPAGAIPSGFTIATSQVQRTKLKRRHRQVTREMDARGGLAPAPVDAKALGKRAYAISMGTGLACCLLAFSADVLIDKAVVQVVAEFLLDSADDIAFVALTGPVTEKLMTAATTSAQSKAATGKQPQPSPPPPPPQPVKESRSWNCFKRKPKATMKTESLPPAPRGEPEVELLPQQPTNVETTTEFAPFGECIVVEFEPVAPGDKPSVPVHAPTNGAKEEMDDDQWQALWTLEDGPVDGTERDLDPDDPSELFGKPVPPKKKASQTAVPQVETVSSSRCLPCFCR